MSKKPVTISLTSVQQDNGQHEVTNQTRQGTLYERDGATWILYDDEGTATTMRLAPEEIRLYRRGEVSSWQVFQLGELTGGMLTLGAGDMILRVMTSHFLVNVAPREGHVELHYELFTAETAEPDADPTKLSLGKFTLAVDWHDTVATS